MLVLLGANHRSAPLGIRERLAFDEAGLPAALQRLVSHQAVEEGLILSTCNRVEILASAGSAGAGLEALRNFLITGRDLDRPELDRYSYHYLGREAVKHLFHVSAGLDSMILGEPQITGQVKQAYRLARRAGTVGTVLERLLQQALSAAKRVRTETGISRNTLSVAYAAVELAHQIFGELHGHTALLLGAGKMSGLVANHLMQQGVDRVIVSSRSYQRAELLARQFGGQALNWDAGLGRLEQVDIVISGTGAAEIVLDRDQVQRALSARRGTPLFLIDIAVPRDIDPAINELDNVYLYDVDDLQGVVDQNLEERNRAAAAARELIEHEVDGFERWLQSLAVAPTIVSVRESLLGVGRREVERFRNRLGPLTPAQAQTIDELTRALIQKILHRPIRHLKASVERGDAARTTRLFHEIFGVEQQREQPARGTEDSGRKRDPAADDTGGRPHRLLRGGKED